VAIDDIMMNCKIKQSEAIAGWYAPSDLEIRLDEPTRSCSSKVDAISGLSRVLKGELSGRSFAGCPVNE
jgi:hypothetical protein